MKKIACIFPGQGSQVVGMGLELYKNHVKAKEVFDIVDEALNQKLSTIIFHGNEEQLKLTSNTQPALMAVSIAMVKVLENELGKKLNEFTEIVLGHSLGEYTSLCSIDSLDISSAAKLLRIRGDAMQNAVPKGEGGMIAILGSNIESIEKILIENENDFTVQIANDNSDGQIILSGRNTDLSKLTKLLKSKSIKNVKLPVSAPFHCPLMSPATKIMNKELFNTNFSRPNNMIVSNVTSLPSNDPKKLRDLLIEQIEKPVRWRESIINMINLGNKKFIEIGPGKVLSGLVKRIDRNVELIQVNNINDLSNLKIND